MQATRIYLVRHGETEWNHCGRYQGHSDIPLNDRGRYQAELLRERLRKVTLHRVYTSDLKRARETATIIARPHNLEVTEVRGLRELNFGAWEGMTSKEIAANYPREWEIWRKKTACMITPQGENFQELRARAWTAFENIVRENSQKNILLVAHGGSLRTIICNVLKMELDNVWYFRLDNSSVSIVDCYGDYKMLVLLNDTFHLESCALTINFEDL